MTIDWEGWRTVLAVARAGTSAGAAVALGIDATTAGRRVRALEERLGRRLFEREGTRLKPTPICADALPSLEAAEEALARTEEATAGTPPGRVRTVRITSVAPLCELVLAPAVPRLLVGRRLRVELIAENRNLSLPRREADAALRLGPPSGGAPAERVGSPRIRRLRPAREGPGNAALGRVRHGVIDLAGGAMDRTRRRTRRTGLSRQPHRGRTRARRRRIGANVAAEVRRRRRSDAEPRRRGDGGRTPAVADPQSGRRRRSPHARGGRVDRGLLRRTSPGGCLKTRWGDYFQPSFVIPANAGIQFDAETLPIRSGSPRSRG